MGNYLRITAGSPEENAELIKLWRLWFCRGGKKVMRTAEITRSTKETQITVWLSLDGGPVEISTGVGFF